ncbi:MAG: hypothetical protein RLZZ312_1649 [Bacteroidota bacterium]|jgi:phosphatidate cytidylyltransferase
MNETLKRTLSGTVYIILLIASLSYSQRSFFLLFGIFLIIATIEFCNLVNLQKIIPVIFSIAFYGSVAYLVLAKIPSSRNFDLSILAAALLVSTKCLFLLYSKRLYIMDKASKHIFMFGYIVLPFVLLTKIPIGINGYNPKIIISIFILIWTNDTFAYIVGKSIGKHKLFESISPKKTIEGFLGGVFFATIAGYFISKYYFDPKENYLTKSILIWTITAFIVGIFGTIGDLVQSKFKRLANVKDSGKIMPGHGGILDRLDSVIFVAPFVYLFYQILNYVTLP